MSITTTELMEGVKLHKINTKKYKTNLLAIYLTSKLDRKHVTENALMLAILRRGTNKLKTQEDINIKLEELYGADFNCGIDKLCNDSVFKFYMESLNDEFLYEKENVLEQGTQMLFDIVFLLANDYKSFTLMDLASRHIIHVLVISIKCCILDSSCDIVLLLLSLIVQFVNEILNVVG